MLFQWIVAVLHCFEKLKQPKYYCLTICQYACPYFWQCLTCKIWKKEIFVDFSGIIIICLGYEHTFYNVYTYTIFYRKSVFSVDWLISLFWRNNVFFFPVICDIISKYSSHIHKQMQIGGQMYVCIVDHDLMLIFLIQTWLLF